MKLTSQQFTNFFYGLQRFTEKWMNDQSTNECAWPMAACFGFVAITCNFIAGLLWTITSAKLLRGERDSPDGVFILAMVCFWISFVCGILFGILLSCIPRRMNEADFRQVIGILESQRLN